MALNRNLPRISTDRFSMVPRGDVPRSTFVTTHSLKTTFHTGYLVPIMVDEVLPGDVHSGQVTVFARVATPLFPIMDAMQVETFFFFVPNRLLWDNWKKMMGERANPSDSISYTLPQVTSPAGGYGVATIYDYMGLPTVGQMGGGATYGHNVLPLRAYNRIWNEWFRDQNLQNQVTMNTGDGPDSNASYVLLQRNKKHDYFTSALPWPVKGGVELTVPLSGTAPITGIAFNQASTPTTGNPATYDETAGNAASGWAGYYLGNSTNMAFRATTNSPNANPMIYADMSLATGQTINAIRLAFQTQRLLERDARSGTRYTELLQSHFGVTPEDVRLQRPEYIGGGRSDIQTQAIPQTSATGLTGGSSPLGALGAAATVADRHSFHYAATEHGYIIGLAHATAEITYQQGVHRLWTRWSRYDFYWPAFAHLGEQAIRNDEIYVQGTAADQQTFGYQERWAEYRHRPSRITGLFRSTSTGTIDPWHLAQRFTSLPLLNEAFIKDEPPVSRALAAGTQANNMQILWDSVFRIRSTRPMPMYSVPGMIDRF